MEYSDKIKIQVLIDKLRKQADQLSEWLIIPANIDSPEFETKLKEQRLILVKIAQKKQSIDPYQIRHRDIFQPNIIIHPVKQI